MKIEFESDKERECLEHILLDWICYCVEDPLGCEPACRDESSSSCNACIEETIKEQLRKNRFSFSAFGGEDYLQNEDIEGNKDSYYRALERFFNVVNVKELLDKLRAVPNTYPEFVSSVIRYASTEESRRDKVLEFLSANPDASVSDIAEFVKSREDFHEAIKSTWRK